MNREIGEIFEYNGEWYQCVEGICNKECYFYNRSLHKTIANINGAGFGACNAAFRSDDKSVIFKKLEKAGEPYNFQGRTFQTYKLHMIPFISEDVELVVIPSTDNNTIEIEIKQDMEDREYSEEEFKNNPRFQHHKSIEQVNNMKKMKPFNLEQAKAGKPVCTRDGRKARIICFDKKCLDGQVLIVLVNCGKEECMYFYTTDGKCIDDFSSFDLMMLPQKKEGWVNLYRKDNHIITSKDVFCSEGGAIECVDDEGDGEYYISTIKISWEE